MYARSQDKWTVYIVLLCGRFNERPYSQFVTGNPRAGLMPRGKIISNDNGPVVYDIDIKLKH